MPRTPRTRASRLALLLDDRLAPPRARAFPDWGGFKEKQDEHTRDEMERFAKDGYLAKQDFLARTDERQADVARTNRRRGMGLKD